MKILGYFSAQGDYNKSKGKYWLCWWQKNLILVSLDCTVFFLAILLTPYPSYVEAKGIIANTYYWSVWIPFCFRGTCRMSVYYNSKAKGKRILLSMRVYSCVLIKKRMQLLLMYLAVPLAAYPALYHVDWNIEREILGGRKRPIMEDLEMVTFDT